jgi:hypothetical protein
VKTNDHAVAAGHSVDPACWQEAFEADLGKPCPLGRVKSEERASDAGVLVDAGGAVGPGASADGEFAAFEVAEEVLPLGFGGSVVLLSGAQGAAAGDEGAVGFDGLGAVPGRHRRAAGGLCSVPGGAGEDPRSAGSAWVGRPCTKPDSLAANKGCSKGLCREYLQRRGTRHTIPEKTDSQAARLRKGSRGRRPPGFDQERYKKRNTVEPAINRLKQFRAVATRYDTRGCVSSAP